MRLPPNATHWAQIQLDAEVSVYLPVFVRYKHYTPEKVTEVLEDLARQLGGMFIYLEEIGDGK